MSSVCPFVCRSVTVSNQSPVRPSPTHCLTISFVCMSIPVCPPLPWKMVPPVFVPPSCAHPPVCLSHCLSVLPWCTSHLCVCPLPKYVRPPCIFQPINEKESLVIRYYLGPYFKLVLEFHFY